MKVELIGGENSRREDGTYIMEEPGRWEPWSETGQTDGSGKMGEGTSAHVKLEAEIQAWSSGERSGWRHGLGNDDMHGI